MYCKKILLPLLIALIFVGFSCEGEMSINKSIFIENGEVHEGDISSVNGNIQVGSKASILGDIHNVNGSVTLEANSEVNSVSIVNGRVRTRKNVRINGKINSVNGNIEIENGTTVQEDINSVNGGISISDSKVRGDISTVNANISIVGESVVFGDIIIPEPSGASFSRKINIHLSDTSILEGSIINEDGTATVTLYKDESATIKGDLKNVIVVNN